VALPSALTYSLLKPHRLRVPNYSLQGQHSARLAFHPVSEDDFATWLPFYQDPRCVAHWTWPDPAQTPEARCQQWFASQHYRSVHQLGGLNTLRERSTGALVGYGGLLVQQVEGVTELEIGYSLLPAYWGLGYASEAALTCKAFATTHQLASSLISIISLSNEASQQVARKMGMQPEKVTWYAGNEVKIFRVALG
jgi:ribosomal-protein-alanine N-acetyltransferase